MFRQIVYGKIESNKLSECKDLEFKVYQCQECKTWIDHTQGEQVVTLKTDPPQDLCSPCHVRRCLNAPEASKTVPRNLDWDIFLTKMLTSIECVHCGLKKKRILFERAFVKEGKGICQSCAKRSKA